MDGSMGFGFKQRWLSEHLIGADNAVSVGGALSFIGEAELPEKVSAHPYNQSAMKLIEAVAEAGGMALDCGAGKRDFEAEHLVQTEVAPFPNIDVLCDAQALPFRDACFDLVLSFDVLEHVPDPYRAAAEMMRVLKPGGTLYIDVPFLQVEHGYPHHYTNFTRQGLRQLFAKLDCAAHVVPASGHPSHVVHTALHTFMAGIPKKERARFLNMSVADILAMPHKQLQATFADGFDPAVVWKMASSTQAIFTKPGDPRLTYALSELPQFAH